MRLEDDVGLPGDEVPRAVGVREERRGRRLQGRGWRFGLNAIRSRCIRQHRIDRLRRSTGHSLRRRLERRDAESNRTISTAIGRPASRLTREKRRTIRL